MRKLFLILAAFLTLAVYSQDLSLDKDQHKIFYTGLPGDTISSCYADVIFEVNKDYWYTVSYMLDIDTLSGGGNDDLGIKLQGSYDNVTYTDIGDSIAYAATADTAFNKPMNTFSQDTVSSAMVTTLPGVDYDFIRILCTDGGDSRAELQKAGIKITPVQIP